MNRYAALVFLLACTLNVSVFLFWHRQKTASSEKQEVLGETTTNFPTDEPFPTILATPPTDTPTTDAQDVTAQTTKPKTITPSDAVALQAKQPKLTSTKAGTVTTLEFSTLSKDTLYKLDLRDIQADTMVFSWPIGTQLYWTLSNNVTFQNLTPVPVDSDTMDYENEKYSGMLEIPSSKIVYVYPQSAIQKLTVSLITPSKDPDSFSVQATTTGVYNQNAGASYTSLPITTRDSWGANPSSWDSNSSSDIDSESRFVWNPVYYKAARIIVHHTATSVNNSSPAAAVRSIYLYHAYVRDSTGWGDIGYNFLIDQNGTIYQGKLGGDETQGYHAFGAANRISIGISLIGDFTHSQPTSAQRSALIKLMAEKAAFYGFTLKYSDGGSSKWRDPSYTVFAHQTSYRWYDSSNSWGVNSTACPGYEFLPKLPGIVSEAEKYRQNNFSQIKAVTNDVNAAFAAPHDQGVIVIEYDVPEDTEESIIQSYLPKFSGITDYEIEGNRVTISITSTITTHPEEGDSEYLLPPMGWTGYDNEYETFSGSFSLNGPEDRAKTLLKIFKLDPRVRAADVRHYLGTQ